MWDVGKQEERNGWKCMTDVMTMYERCLAGMEREFEEMVEGLVSLHPWIEGQEGNGSGKCGRGILR